MTDRRPSGGETKPPAAIDAATMRRMILAEQVALLYKSPVPLITNLVNAAIMAGVMWPALPPGLALAWFATVAVVLSGRQALRTAFRRRTVVDDVRWAHLHVIGM